MSDTSRRSFLKLSAGFAAGAFVGPRLVRGAAPGFELIETKVISPDDGIYRGWPSVTRTKNGELVCVCSGGRESHVCPFGRVEMFVSKDDGASWSGPRTLIDGPIDDRDAGVLETAKGTLLVTTFTSLAYVPILEKAEANPDSWDKDRLARWQAVHNKLTVAQRQAELGVWMIRSTDGGKTWTEPYSSIVNSPHGPIQLKDGRLLYPGKELWHGEKRVGVAVSHDDGQSWEWLADIPTREGDSRAEYHELHGVETADGKLVVHIRNHNANHARETLQTESSDGGKTWSIPRSIGVWGLPSFLTRLQDDRLLMSYGHRRAPLGNQARLSEDGGKTWGEPLPISADGVSGDLGYPSTVQLEDGSLLTIWYEKMQEFPHAVLRQAKWKLV
ncbi:MAG TPA: sialidase family protein [Planctomycetaceae bacterium]|nr:sialidase family protein [Planctomycetaceae bacterium]